MHSIFVFIHQRTDENVTGLHKNPRAIAKDIRQQDRQSPVKSNQRKSFLNANPKYQDQDILRYQPPPPSKPPPSIAPAALQALFLQNIRTGECPDTGASVLAVDLTDDQGYPPYPNQLQRSATLPAKHNRLGVRSRVTFKVPTTITPSQSPAAVPSSLPSAAILEKNSNIATPNNFYQVAYKETSKMTSEDLLQPGHVVKERWKVYDIHLHTKFLLSTI